MKHESKNELLREFGALEWAASVHSAAYVGIGDGCLSDVLERMRIIVDNLKIQGGSEETHDKLKSRIDALIRY